MTVGTKSVLYGAHAFWLHPFIVAWAWWKLEGFPLNPRLWAAFFLHDIGYIGKPNMDGPKGKTHPRRGARIMFILFGEEWLWFTLYHSRSMAKMDGAEPSKLCAADKLAFNLTPKWLYLKMVNWTGEIAEYKQVALKSMGEYPCTQITDDEWYDYVAEHNMAWVRKNCDANRI